MSLSEIPSFTPHRLLRGGNRQTIAGVYLPGQQHPYQAERHFIDLPDGDQLVLHDDCPPDWQDGDRIALLIHGLGGCHGSPYLVRIAAKLNTRGVRVFRKDLRGWGAGAMIARQPFHAARTEDIADSLKMIQQLAPQSPIALVGFSLGANMVLKLLGDVGTGCRPVPEAAHKSEANRSLEQGERRPSHRDRQAACPHGIDRAMAIAPPIDLMHCCRNLERGFGRVYDRKYARFLWNHLRERSGIVPAFAAALREQQPRRIYDFDERFTAPLGGFDSVEHYYETASAKRVLGKITVPTLVLSADDDPIVPGHVFNDVALSPCVQLHLTDHGGHLGFIAAYNGEPDRRWMDWRVVDFVTE